MKSFYDIAAVKARAPVIEPTRQQLAAIEAGQSSFLEGPAGTGKSLALQYRMLNLLKTGQPAYTLLVLVAEPEHVEPYLATIQQTAPRPYTELLITTYTHLARQMVTLFWPLLARQAGFERPFQPPTFLSYDLAQLLMWKSVAPMLDEGAFADLPMRPQQIVSQLLDTLNRAALNGLTLEEASSRQARTWAGEQDHLRHLASAASAADHFRQICLANNLLDLSLVVQVFDTQLVRHSEFRRYFSERFRHLIVDNLEEQTPAGQNFISDLMVSTETTALAYDSGGGYKRFMAADPKGANQFFSRCQNVFYFEDSYTTRPALPDLANLVENYLLDAKNPSPNAGQAIAGIIGGRYRREMVNDLARYLAELIQEKDLALHEVAIIAPYLDSTLRYTLAQALRNEGLPYFLLRRRSSPRDEPRVRAWLTWLALAHPEWGIVPVVYDVAEALSLSIAGMDPARAQLVAERLYDPGGPMLLPAELLSLEIAGRTGLHLVELVEELRLWLRDNGRGMYPVDVFLHRLFTMLLATPRFQPEPDLRGAAVCDWLVRTAGRLRWAAEPMGYRTTRDQGVAFIEGIQKGLVSANPPDIGDPPDPAGMMVSTIYGYLLAGRPVRYQVWLETAASGWWDIPRQPLSNAFVLAQSWDPEQPWTMTEDFAVRNELLSRIVQGLTSRCSEGIILASSDLDRRGARQDGPLWRALYPVRKSGVES